MRSTKQTLLAAALTLGGLGLSLNATASIQWSFDIGGCNPDAYSVGNQCTFEPLGGAPVGTQDALATAWANTGSGGLLEEAIMRDHGASGAGIRHADGAGWESTTSPQHAMDNDGFLEFMLFDFQGQEVQLTDVTLGWETDSDLTILAYTGAGAPDLSDGELVTGAGSQNLTSNGWVSVAQIANADYYFDFSSKSNGITSSYWIVATYAQAFGGCNIGSGGCGQGQDHVKLWDVGGIIHDDPGGGSSVPLPASALLLGSLLPLVRRRRAS